MRSQVQNKIHYVIGLVMLSLMACSSPSEYTPFTQALAQVIEQSPKQQTVVVIPGEGCGGCISDATSYVFDKADEPGLSIVFTGVEDRKLLIMQLGEDFLEKENVYLDADNLFMHQEVASIYPRILSLKSGQVQDIQDFDQSYFEP